MTRSCRLAIQFLLVAGCGGNGLPGDGGAGDRSLFPDASAAPDLAGADLAGADLSTTAPDLAGAVDFAGADLAASIPANLDGIWLIGWSGGLNHYSWLRFTSMGFGFGTVEILDPMGNAAWTPYFCSGKGTFGITQAPDTIAIMGTCANMYILHWTDFYPPGLFPQGAILASHLNDLSSGNPMVLDGWKFDANQCDANFTMCTLPN
jgi:hypothetical protein